MPFKKGQSGNPDGRPKGSQNGYTKDIKEAFGKLLGDNLDNFNIWLAQVAADDPAKALDLVVKISERFVPKLSQQAITGADGEDLFKNITFQFGDAEDYIPDEL